MASSTWSTKAEGLQEVRRGQRSRVLCKGPGEGLLLPDMESLTLSDPTTQWFASVWPSGWTRRTPGPLPLLDAWQGSQVCPAVCGQCPGLAGPAQPQDLLPDTSSLGRLSAIVDTNGGNCTFHDQLPPSMSVLNLLPVS